MKEYKNESFDTIALGKRWDCHILMLILVSIHVTLNWAVRISALSWFGFACYFDGKYNTKTLKQNERICLW